MADRDPLDYLSAADGPEHPDRQFAERLIDSLLSDLEDAPDTGALIIEVLDLQKDASPMTSPSKKWLFPLLAAAAAIVVIVGVVVADGDSDNGLEQLETEQPTVVEEPTAAQKYCEAGQSLESSINALVGLVGVDDARQALDLVTQSTSVTTMNDDLESAIDAVEDDLDALQETATDAAADEVDVVERAMGDLNDALSKLSSNLFTSSETADLDNAAAAQDAAQGVATAAQAVYGTLTDCP
jgi:hypothetical protein